MRRVLRAIDSGYINFLLWATSSKKAAWILTGLIAAAVVADPPKSLQALLLVVISEYYQGVALPAIGAASAREGESTRKLLQETHDTAMAEMAEVKAMHVEVHEKLDRILAILEEGR